MRIAPTKGPQDEHGQLGRFRRCRLRTEVALAAVCGRAAWHVDDLAAVQARPCIAEPTEDGGHIAATCSANAPHLVIAVVT